MVYFGLQSYCQIYKAMFILVVGCCKKQNTWGLLELNHECDQVNGSRNYRFKCVLPSTPFLSSLFYFSLENKIYQGFPWRSTLSFHHSLRQLWNPRGKFCLKNSPVSCCPWLKLITFIKHYRSANVMHCYPQLMQSREHLQYSGVCVCVCGCMCKSCSLSEESRRDYSSG